MFSFKVLCTDFNEKHFSRKQGLNLFIFEVLMILKEESIQIKKGNEFRFYYLRFEYLNFIKIYFG